MPDMADIRDTKRRKIHFLPSGALHASRADVPAKSVQLCPTLQTMDYNLPASSVRGFSRKKYWSGLPFPSLAEEADMKINYYNSIQVLPECRTRRCYRRPRKAWITAMAQVVPGRLLRGERRLEELTIWRKRKAILTTAVNGDWTGSGELGEQQVVEEVGGLAHSLWARGWRIWT